MSSQEEAFTPADPESQSLASTLIHARNLLGLTQAQLSEKSGVSRSAIKGYESGRNMPGARELKALSVVLGVSPNVLLFGTETPFEPKPEPKHVEGDDLDFFIEYPDELKVIRARLVILSSMLTHDEAVSLLKLVQGLAIARRGITEVKNAIYVADKVTGMATVMARAAKTHHATGAEIDPEGIANQMADFIEHHNPDVKKSPP